MPLEGEDKTQPGRPAGNRTKYLYDGDNRRVRKTNAQTTHFFYDPWGRILTEMNHKDEVSGGGIGWGEDYVYVPNAPIARVDWSVVTNPNYHGCSRGAELCESPRIAIADLLYYHTDHLGTPIAMTNQSDELVWQAEYMPFGDLYSSPVTTVENNLRFPGQYFDSETGLHQNWFRDYAPKTGRYPEADPIGLLGGANSYGYARANSVNAIDPLGLCDSEARQTRCGPRPKSYAAPAGESIGRDLAWATSVSKKQWYSGVQNRGPKDYKRAYRGDPTAEPFGNFSYGATAYMQGLDDFAPDFIQWGAGAYSWWSNLGARPNQKAPSYGTPFPVPSGWPILLPAPIWPYGDDIRDAQAIADGVRFAKWFACRAGLEN